MGKGLGSDERLLNRDGSSVDNESKHAVPLVYPPIAASTRPASVQHDPNRAHQLDVFG